ncbi:oxidative stress-induced growth inhibitor 1-like [Lineus longissimus]|uniref:oxidative stress-induced growth inhibitor 1-like n=1 Tax=Lineus longissimus TaxID=88925 RepID=UPI00315D31FE
MARRSCCIGKRWDITYKDAIIVGNGPSAITLSFLLSGNTPYYNGAPVPNEFLQYKLSDNPDKSLFDLDLEYLSEGLEGRSNNPVALLFDILTKPNADLGSEVPSTLNWRKHEKEICNHVVLGKGRPGGVWQSMDGSMNTLSLGNWMELPNMSFREWSMKYRSHKGFTGMRSDRASLAEVGQYYHDYVKEKGLEKNFLDRHTVTTVQKVLDINTQIVDDESGEIVIGTGDTKNTPMIWEVCGKKHIFNEILEEEVLVEEFCFRTPNVILATGSYDQPNKLGIPGENLPHVIHSVQDLEGAIRDGLVSPDSDPVVVVGAGLSAADAILYAEDFNLPVVHVFRRLARDPMLIFNKLPKAMYPEYHMIHSMMKREHSSDLYTPYEAHSIKECMPSGQVIIHDNNNQSERLVQSSLVLVNIGSKPDLSFLRNDGKHLGVIEDEQIDCKNNPVDIDLITYESNKEPGLFAIGPLISDNFVRFIQGGSLGVASHLHKKFSCPEETSSGSAGKENM